jgi:hypothetical protein
VALDLCVHAIAAVRVKKKSTGAPASKRSVANGKKIKALLPCRLVARPATDKVADEAILNMNLK